MGTLGKAPGEWVNEGTVTLCRVSSGLTHWGFALPAVTVLRGLGVVESYRNYEAAP